MCELGQVPHEMGVHLVNSVCCGTVRLSIDSAESSLWEYDTLDFSVDTGTPVGLLLRYDFNPKGPAKLRGLDCSACNVACGKFTVMGISSFGGAGFFL